MKRHSLDRYQTAAVWFLFGGRFSYLFLFHVLYNEDEIIILKINGFSTRARVDHQYHNLYQIRREHVD